MSEVLIGLLLSLNMFARTYGGTQNDYAYSMAQSSDGGYIVTGSTYSFGAGSQDFLVLKMASDGTVQWSKSLGGTGDDVAYSMAQSSDGGYVVAGYTRSFGIGGSDLLVLKLASDGSLEWTKTFGGTDNDALKSVAQTTDGGYVVAGSTYSFGTSLSDLLVLKLASDGTLQWAKTFGGASYDYANSVAQTTDGGYIVAGLTSSFGAGGTDFLVLKLTSDGSFQWAKTFGGTSNDAINSVIQTTDGGYVVAGYTWSFGTGASDFLVIKLASDGTLQWAKTFGGTSNDVASSVAQDSDGGCVIAGSTISFGAGDNDFLVIKLASDGSFQWAKTFGGTTTDIAYPVIQTTDGGYVVAGYTWSFGTGGSDFLVLKLASDGEYTGCITDCIPIETTPIPSEISHSENVSDCTPSSSSPSPNVGSPSLTITDVCTPLYTSVDEELRGQRIEGISFSPAPDGVIFLTSEDVDIRVYAADGRLTYSGRLRRGRNSIRLDKGVYLWQAETQKGKVVVR